MTERMEPLTDRERMACCQSGRNDGGYILAVGGIVPGSSPQDNIQTMV